MTREEFEPQITRMRQTWGERQYPNERAAMIWRAFQRDTAEAFIMAVDELIAKSRQAPMLDEISKTMELMRVTRNQSYRGGDGIATVMNDAARTNRKADPDFVQACLKLLREKLDGKLSMDQFLQGCGMLDEVAQRLNPQKKNPGKQLVTAYRAIPNRMGVTE